MFRLVNDMGFQVESDNGYTVSVMFSSFAYCSNRQLLNPQTVNGFPECPNAEIAVKDTVTQEFIPIDGEDVQGYQTVNDFIRLINNVRDYPNTDSKMDEMKKLKEIPNEVSTRNSL